MRSDHLPVATLLDEHISDMPSEPMLASFVAQQRMKLPGTEYVPCYRIKT